MCCCVFWWRWVIVLQIGNCVFHSLLYATVQSPACLALQLLLLPHLQQLPVPSHRPKLRLELLEALPVRQRPINRLAQDLLRDEVRLVPAAAREDRGRGADVG